MAYGKKQKENKSFILNRIKDYTTLEVGKEYHLRKMLSRDGNVIKDEVHDVVLKEFKDGNFISTDDASFMASDFRIYIRKPL